MEPVINFIEMFAQSLNLKAPWYIERAEYNEKTREVRLYVGVKRQEYRCPRCGEKSHFYDLEEERIWRHNDVVLFPVMCIVDDPEFPVKRMAYMW